MPPADLVLLEGDALVRSPRPEGLRDALECVAGEGMTDPNFGLPGKPPSLKASLNIESNQRQAQTREQRFDVPYVSVYATQLRGEKLSLQVEFLESGAWLPLGGRISFDRVGDNRIIYLPIRQACSLRVICYGSDCAAHCEILPADKPLDTSTADLLRALIERLKTVDVLKDALKGL